MCLYQDVLSCHVRALAATPAAQAEWSGKTLAGADVQRVPCLDGVLCVLVCLVLRVWCQLYISSCSILHWRLTILFSLLFAMEGFAKLLLSKLSWFTFSGCSWSRPDTCILWLTGLTGGTLLPTKSCLEQRKCRRMPATSRYETA